MWGRVINWEIHDSSSIRNTWGDSQSSFTCPLWLMHLLPVYNMYDHIARTHNIGSCIIYRGCLNMMMVKPAISISHPAGTTGFHFEWLGLWEGSVWVLGFLTVTASAGFDPANRSDLTQQFSVVSCLTAKKHFSTKTTLFSLIIFYNFYKIWNLYFCGGRANNVRALKQNLTLLQNRKTQTYEDSVDGLHQRLNMEMTDMTAP